MFKYIYESLLLLFNRTDKTKSNKKQKPDEIKNVTIEKKPFLCSLNFELGFDGIINITCFWPELQSINESAIANIAEQYAKMIFIIDNGMLKKDIIETLYDVNNNNDPYDIFFVQEVLDKWLEQVEKTEKKNNKPVVRPLNVFKTYYNTK